MYLRRTVANGPQWGNVGSCPFVPFVCFALAGVDEASGGQFNLIPNPLHAELQAESEAEATPGESRVVFFNGDPGCKLTFSIDGGEECALKPKQYTTRVLPSGRHRRDAYHWDVFKMTGHTPLELDGSDVAVLIYPTVYSTHAAFANEVPADFEEVCVAAGQSAETLQESPPVPPPTVAAPTATASHEPPVTNPPGREPLL